MDPPLAQPPPAVYRPQSTQDLEPQKEKITNFYQLMDTVEIVEEEPFAPFDVDAPLDQASIAESRQIFHRPQSTQDLENQNEKITHLYELEDTTEIVEEELFEPSAVDAPLYQAPFAESQRIFPRPQWTQDWESQIAQFSGCYEFNEPKTTTKLVEEQLFGTFAINPPLVQVPDAVSQQSFCRPQSAQNCEYQQPKITDRYESNELNEFLKIAEEELLTSFAMNSPLV